MNELSRGTGNPAGGAERCEALLVAATSPRPPARLPVPLQKIWDARLVPLLAPIWLYKKGLSPLLPPACRHYPTCSEYAFEAIKQRGIVQGLTMGTWRVLRCNPWGTSGYDPVEAFRWPWQAPITRAARPGDEADDARPA